MFSPSTPQTPGTSAVDVVMSISTTTSKADRRMPSARASGGPSVAFPYGLSYGIWLLLPAIVIGWGMVDRRPRRRRSVKVACITALFTLITLSLLSCGGVSTGAGGTMGTPVTYSVTVTGTSPGALPDAGQSVQVILVVD